MPLLTIKLLEGWLDTFFNESVVLDASYRYLNMDTVVYGCLLFLPWLLLCFASSRGDPSSQRCSFSFLVSLGAELIMGAGASADAKNLSLLTEFLSTRVSGCYQLLWVSLAMIEAIIWDCLQYPQASSMAYVHVLHDQLISISLHKHLTSLDIAPTNKASWKRRSWRSTSRTWTLKPPWSFVKPWMLQAPEEAACQHGNIHQGPR